MPCCSVRWLGSERVRRAGFGVAPENDLFWICDRTVGLSIAKLGDCETRSPARVTRALPKLYVSLQSKVSQLTTPLAKRK